MKDWPLNGISFSLPNHKKDKREKTRDERRMNRQQRRRSEGALQGVGGGSGPQVGSSSAVKTQDHQHGRTARLRSTSTRFKEAAADENFRKEIQLARLNALESDNFSNPNEQLTMMEDDEYVEEGLDANDDDEVVYPGRKRRKKKLSAQGDQKKALTSSALQKNKLVINLSKILDIMVREHTLVYR